MTALSSPVFIVNAYLIYWHVNKIVIVTGENIWGIKGKLPAINEK